MHFSKRFKNVPFQSNWKRISFRQKRKDVMIAVTITGLALLLIVFGLVAYLWRRRYKAASYLQPRDEKFEMNPDAKPNLARLRLILETELRRGELLGSGAFGDVYKVRSFLHCRSSIKVISGRLVSSGFAIETPGGDQSAEGSEFLRWEGNVERSWNHGVDERRLFATVGRRLRRASVDADHAARPLGQSVGVRQK
jgi:hypothetical protein